MNAGRAEKERPRSIALEVVLWVLLVFTALIGLVVMGMQAIGSVGCNGVCRYDLLQSSGLILLAGLPIVVTLAVTARVILRKQRYSAVAVPLAGTLLVIAVLVASFAASQAGYAPMYERNERAAELLSPLGSLPNP